MDGLCESAVDYFTMGCRLCREITKTTKWLMDPEKRGRIEELKITVE